MQFVVRRYSYQQKYRCSKNVYFNVGAWRLISRLSDLPPPPSIKFIRQEFQLTELDKIGRISSDRISCRQFMSVWRFQNSRSVAGQSVSSNPSIISCQIFVEMCALRYFSALEFFVAERNSGYQDNILMSSAAPPLRILLLSRVFRKNHQHFVAATLLMYNLAIADKKKWFFARFKVGENTFLKMTQYL